MYPSLPVEVSGSVAQMVVCFLAAVAALSVILLSVRANVTRPRGRVKNNFCRLAIRRDPMLDAHRRRPRADGTLARMAAQRRVGRRGGDRRLETQGAELDHLPAGRQRLGLRGGLLRLARLGWSLVGTALGLGLLLPAYAIGGMGAGDVKLLAGVGAWVGAAVTLYAFCVSAIFGGIIAVAMVLLRRQWRHHAHQFWHIVNEIAVVRRSRARWRPRPPSGRVP